MTTASFLGASAGAHAHGHARALLLADGDELTYRVMRCVCDAGLQAHVVGTEGSGATRLAHSSYCAGFHAVEAGTWHSAAAVARVNALAQELGTSLVLATDPATTRFLVRHGDLIDAEIFPVPSAATFERLVNKDSFAALCASMGLPHPRTEVCADPDELLEKLGGFGRRPLMIKPVDAHASHGVWKLVQLDAATRERIRRLDHRPIVAQEFIEGFDVNALLLCSAGRILASIAYRLGATEFTVVDDERIRTLLENTARALRLDGAIGFDMRMDARGRIWFLECNPRFTYEGSLVGLLSGYNILKQFLEPGTLASRAPPGRMHRAKLFRPWSLLSRDRRHARYLLADARHNIEQACREFYLAKIHRSAGGFGT
jgi:biotin carboxylase